MDISRLKNKTPQWLKSKEILYVTYGVVLAALVTLAINWIRTWNDPAPLATQLESIRASAEKEELEPIVDRSVDLRATEQPAHLFVFRPEALREEPFKSNLSDELRLYNENDGELSLSFAFKPEINAGNPMLFKLAAVKDLDGNGRPEILGSVSPQVVDALEAVPLPIVIAWDDASAEYQIYPLNREPPELSRPKRPGQWAEAAWHTYHQQVFLADPIHHHIVQGYPVDGYAVARSPHGSSAIIEAYVDRARCHFCETTLEIQFSTARYQSSPETVPCIPLPLSRRKHSVTVSLGHREWAILRPSQFLSQEKTNLGKKFECFN